AARELCACALIDPTPPPKTLVARPPHPFANLQRKSSPPLQRPHPARGVAQTKLTMPSSCAGPTPGQPNRTPRGQRKQQMTTWRYLLFISSSREAEADAYQRLPDELNDLGQQGWELTTVTDEGDAKIFILKQPNEVTVDPSALA